MDEKKDIKHLEGDKRIRFSGGCLIVSITKELRAMNLDHGDMVHVTLDKVE